MRIVTRLRVVLALVSTLPIAGCGATRGVAIFARTTNTVPTLKGHSVAVLPPMTVGSEMRPAVVAARASETIFADELGGVSFWSGEDLLAKLQEEPTVFATIRGLVTANLPADFGPDGDTRTVLENNTVGGVERKETYTVTLREGIAVPALAPEQIDAALLSPLGTDYVLVSVPFAAYVDVTRVGALYFILPFFGSGHLFPLTPRGLFVLYECQSGRKVWEGQIGTLGPADGGDGIDRRTDPVLGVAYLLSGEIDAPLARLLDSPSMSR